MKPPLELSELVLSFGASELPPNTNPVEGVDGAGVFATVLPNLKPPEPSEVVVVADGRSKENPPPGLILTAETSGPFERGLETEGGI